MTSHFGPANACAASSVSGVVALVADEHEHVGVRRREHGLERVDSVAARLGGVERRAAADGDDAARRQPQVRRHLREPLGLRGDRAFASVLPATGASIPWPAMGVFERHSLSNGLRVLTAPMPHAQSVSCFVMLAAGSRYETAETNGIAHFAEHMFFKGTERRPTARDIAGEIDSIGGEFNAFTGKEYTGYYVRCAAETRDTALDVLVDMIRNSRFDAEEIEREKGVIVEEMNMYFDTPRDFIGGVYETLLYGDQPLGWDIIGRKETVRERDARDVPRLHEHLVPARADGRRRRRADRRRARTRGSRSCSATSRRPRRGDAGRRGGRAANGRVKVHTKQSDQAHLVLGVRSRPLVDPDRYVLQLLATVLGGGMSSRLFTEVRERRGLAYYVFGTNHAYTDAGSLYAQSGVDINRIDEAVTTIVEQFRLLADEPVPVGRAREGAQLREGPLRAPAREPARDDHVRAAARGARRAGARSRRPCSTRSTRSPPRTSSASRRRSSRTGRTSP